MRLLAVVVVASAFAFAFYSCALVFYTVGNLVAIASLLVWELVPTRRVRAFLWDHGMESYLNAFYVSLRAPSGGTRVAKWIAASVLRARRRMTKQLRGDPGA